MAQSPDLHSFQRDLRDRPGKGSNAPPVSIRARDLDGNFSAVTLIEGEGDPPLYDVRYTKNGTIITRILPDGENPGDLLYWTGEAWAVLEAPEAEDLRVLTIQNGTLTWTQTEDC